MDGGFSLACLFTGGCCSKIKCSLSLRNAWIQNKTCLKSKQNKDNNEIIPMHKNVINDNHNKIFNSENGCNICAYYLREKHNVFNKRSICYIFILQIVIEQNVEQIMCFCNIQQGLTSSGNVATLFHIKN